MQDHELVNLFDLNNGSLLEGESGKDLVERIRMDKEQDLLMNEFSINGMDKFWALLPTVDNLQEKATLAATKAQSLAKEFAEKTQAAANVAASNAKQLTKKIAEDARGLTEEGGWQAAASKVKEQFQKAVNLTTDTFSPNQTQTNISQSDLESFGITSEYKDFIRSLDYSTFRDFNDEQMDPSVGFIRGKDESLRLNPWQEKHAMLALSVSTELDHLRYLLCPKRMTEEKFWLVYFSLAYTQLPDGCKSGKLPERDEQSDIVILPNEVEFDKKPEVAEGKGAEKQEESDEDDLDKYLNDVLEEGSNRAHSTSESFDNFDELMEELNAQNTEAETTENLEQASKQDTNEENKTEQTLETSLKSE